MGSKQVREAHLMKYGAPLSEVHTGKHEQGKVRAHSIDRLSKAAKTINRRKGSPKSNQQQTAQAPSETDDDTARGAENNLKYPKDWRRLPTPVSGSEPTDVEWLYGVVPIPRHFDIKKVHDQARHLVDHLLQSRGVHPVEDAKLNNRQVRTMIKDPRRFGLLIDIVSTKRNILGGTPHDVASAIQLHVEKSFPIAVKFVFIGITDNGIKRLARDVFGAQVAPTAHFTSGEEIGPQHHRRIDFDSIDNYHLFVAHPKGDEADELRRRRDIDLHQKEEDRRRRTFTPKFVPRPPPEWLVKLKERQEESDKQLTEAAGNGLVVVQEPEIENCSRCWIYGRQRSPTPSNPSRAAKSPTSRPLSSVSATTTPFPQGSFERPSSLLNKLQPLGSAPREKRAPSAKRLLRLEDPNREVADNELLKIVRTAGDRAGLIKQNKPASAK